MNGSAVTLYVRKGCHLCENAEALLRRLGCEPVLVDVDSDSELQLRYGNEVPVLAVEGRVVLSGIIGEAQARSVLSRLGRPS